MAPLGTTFIWCQTMAPPPPTGAMKAFLREDRKTSPFGLSYTEDGKRIRRFFQTEKARRDFIREQRLGTSLEGFNALEWHRWLDIKRECDLAGITPEQAVGGFIRANVDGASKTMTLKEAVYEFMEDRRRAKRSEDYLSHLDAVLSRQLIPALGGDRRIITITKTELEAFLEGSNTSSFTFKNHRSYIRALFHWAYIEGHLAADTTEKIKSRPTPKLEPKFLTVDQAKELFAANAEDPELCALLAVQAFTGLRAANIGRLRPQDIRLTERQMIISADRMKGGRRHLLEEHNVFPNLWAWLEAADFEKLFDPKQDYLTRYQYRRGLAFTSARIPRIKNALRHSFATYKCALDGEATKAAYTLAQRDPYVLWEHYKGCATKEQAEAYARILPGQIHTNE